MEEFNSRKPMGGSRQHAMLCSTWEAVKKGDPAWIELSELFGIDEKWSEEKLAQGLLYWQKLDNKITRLSLVSPSVSKMVDATPADRKPISWVRLGGFLFEQLPKGWLDGIARLRWQVSSEGLRFTGDIIKKRIIKLDHKALVSGLNHEHRQVPLARLPEDLLDRSPGLLEDGQENVFPLDERRHICGGVLVMAEKTPGHFIPLPAALS